MHKHNRRWIQSMTQPNKVRVIIYCRHPDFAAVCASADKSYPYKYNFAHTCVEVGADSELFLVMKLKYNMALHIDHLGKQHVPEYSDMPTYAIQDKITDYKDE